MIAVLDEIKTRGYWEVAVRPGQFKRDRLAFSALDVALSSATVHFRGWDFPHFSRNDRIARGDDFIEQESRWEHHLEVWRFFQSGQCIVLTGMAHDWRDRSKWWPADEDWRPGDRIGVGEVLYRYSEILEFAWRLMSRVPGDDDVLVSATLNGLKGRHLVMDDPSRWFWPSEHPASISTFAREARLSREDLDRTRRDIAATWASELFERFDKNISATVLRDWQDKFWRG